MYVHACIVQCTMYMQEMDDADDRITSELYIEGGSNYTAISSLAWRYSTLYTTSALPYLHWPGGTLHCILLVHCHIFTGLEVLYIVYY